LAADYHQHRKFFERNNDLVFLVEECIDYARIKAAQDAGIPIVCCPHNIETLQSCEGARDHYSGEELPWSLHRELSFAGLADRIFTISSEEAWLLANYGAKAEWLPYFPPDDDAKRLTALRKRRECSGEKRGFFFVASCENTKNAEGMREFAGLARNLPVEIQKEIRVGGYASEQLRGDFAATKCQFVGELPGIELDKLLVRCAGAIIYQNRGAGALTRVPEMLLAGLPVICSSHAARSARHYQGVEVFQTSGDLLDLLRKPASIPPPPTRDGTAEQRFAAFMKSAAVSAKNRTTNQKR